MQGILRHINFDIVKCIILASPGFVKDQFMDYMIQQAIKLDNKIILENKGKFLLVHSSSGFKHSLKGIFFKLIIKLINKYNIFFVIYFFYNRDFSWTRSNIANFGNESIRWSKSIRNILYNITDWSF